MMIHAVTKQLHKHHVNRQFQTSKGSAHIPECDIAGVSSATTCVAKLGHLCAYVWTHKRSQVNFPESGHKAKASYYLERLTKWKALLFVP